MKMKKFSNTSSQNDIIGELTRQTCNNIENLHENSPPQCQDFLILQYSTGMLQ